mmetsp:Transcript_27239/g.82718  ORF Transcript_27239/g.82718 Transcript_27239/m.82718 type:complete len:216 (+) Transcript_27239:392-1039(+)
MASARQPRFRAFRSSMRSAPSSTLCTSSARSAHQSHLQPRLMHQSSWMTVLSLPSSRPLCTSVPRCCRSARSPRPQQLPTCSAGHSCSTGMRLWRWTRRRLMSARSSASARPTFRMTWSLVWARRARSALRARACSPTACSQWQNGLAPARLLLRSSSCQSSPNQSQRHQHIVMFLRRVLLKFQLSHRLPWHQALSPSPRRLLALRDLGIRPTIR